MTIRNAIKHIFRETFDFSQTQDVTRITLYTNEPVKIHVFRLRGDTVTTLSVCIQLYFT